MKSSLFTLQIFLLSFLFLTSSAVSAEFRKSPNDHREYRALQLENRMSVLLISDSETDEAAAALAVRVGGQDDPEDRPGMAHYLEHLLFLGTEKYPEIDEYRTFIVQNGGSSNAFTSVDITNYNFSIKPEFLRPALDRFAQFFISPLFPEEQLDRERSVVDDENEMRIENDGVRRWSALRAAFNPEHPSAGFFTGTMETLQGDILPELLDFYNSRYSSNLMNLVILGKESLDELEEMAVSMFSEVNDSDAQVLQATQPLFEEGVIPALLQIKTLKNNPTLGFKFPVPSLTAHWRESPEGYISHILGHEGEGSLLSQLRAKGWADGLFASSSDIGLTTHTLEVSISLTPKGYQEWEQIGAYVFQYIREVRNRGINEWRFNEIQTTSEIGFRYSEIESPRDFATSMASLLHKYPPNDILPAIYQVEKYAPELIISYLDLMKPENLLLELESPDVWTDSVTPYIGTEYSLTSLDPNLVEMWNQDIADSGDWLPRPNEFLPKSLDLVETEESSVPIRISEKSGFELWHQADTSFDVPRASFFVSVRSPAAKNSVENSILLSLFVDTINDQLNEFTYFAYIAGLEYSLYGHQRGFSVRISGFDDNQLPLLKEIVHSIKNPKFDPDKFEIHRTALIRDIENSRHDSAYRRAISKFFSLIVEPSWTEEEELEALAKVTLADLAAFSDRLLEKIEIAVMSHGNVLSETAIEMADIITSELLDVAEPTEVKKNVIMKLPTEGGPNIYSFDVEKSDSVVVMYVQGLDRTVEEMANFTLLASVIQTPFFSQLRTVQQLGYVVFANMIPVAQVPGLVFTVQSPDNLPDDLELAISEFLAEFESMVTSLPDEEFEAYRNGVIQQILTEDTTLSDRSQRYWRAIDREDHDFNDDEELAAVLENLQRSEFEGFVREFLDRQKESRLIFLGYGEKLEKPDDYLYLQGRRIDDRIAFKRDAEYFPHQ